MKKLRELLFWGHLAAGLLAGLPIAIMSFTGILLAFQPQLLSWSESALRESPSLPLKDAVSAAQAARPDESLTSVTLRPSGSVEASFGERAFFVGPDGSLKAASSLRRPLHRVEDVHRYLASRRLGKPVTGFCTLLFCLITLSGLALWWPRGAAKPLLAFDPKLKGKAFDFNTHNAVGLWCMPVLFVLSFSGVVIAYPAATALVYKAAGEEAPKQGGGRGEGKAERPPLPDLPAAAVLAQQKAPDWTAVTFRLPAKPGAPLNVSITAPGASPRQARSTLTLDAATLEVQKWEPASEMTRGRRWRTWLRFLHTGEALGVLGQLVAALACAGALLLAWTGLMLSWRRLRPAR